MSPFKSFIMTKKEYKVVKTTHKHSPKPDKEAYAIVVSTYLLAEPDSEEGVYLENPDNMYIIAYRMADAHLFLLEHLE